MKCSFCASVPPWRLPWGCPFLMTWFGIERRSNIHWRIPRLDWFSPKEMSTSAVKRCLYSNKEGILSIALWELSRITQIALHCRMSRIIFLWFFTEWVVGTTLLQIGLKCLSMRDDSRSSSQVLEHENFRLVSQLHVAIQTPWSRCLPPRAGGTSVHQRVRPVLTRSASTSLSVSLSFSTRSTNKWVLSQSSEKRVSISWALERDVRSVSTSRPVLWIGLGFGWVGWEPSACRATSGPNSFKLFPNEVFGSGRGDSDTFSKMTSPVSILTIFGIQ